MEHVSHARWKKNVPATGATATVCERVLVLLDLTPSPPKSQCEAKNSISANSWRKKSIVSSSPGMFMGLGS